MTNKRKEYYDEINIARGLGVLLVLLGHSFPDAEIGVFAHPIYQWAYDACYSFHMALFFVISGFVMGRRFYQTEYSFRKEILKKLKRLLIPYLFLAYVSLLPKIALNAYARNPVDAGSTVKVLFGQSPNGSLWYLYTLFVFSGFTLGCGRLFRFFQESTKSFFMILCGCMGYVLHIFAGETALQLIFMDKICKYLVFYVLGMLLYRYYDRLRKYGHCIAAVLSLALVIILADPYLALSIDYGITAILGTYGILVIADRITRQKESKVYGFLDGCGNRSYDIYILSYYVQQTIRVICFRIRGWDYAFVFMLELILGFVLSYIFSVYVLRRSRMLKRILIGVWEE